MSYDAGEQLLSPAPPTPVQRQAGAEQHGGGGTVVPAPAAADPLLPVAEIIKLDYAALLNYLKTRPRDHVTTLRAEGAFRTRLRSFSTAELTQLTLTILIRTPDTVVDGPAARTEAFRILASQLQDKDIMMRLIENRVSVVIVPRDKLMTDLPEFASQRGRFTFDGRPWDITRGLGGRETAIAEENLLGLSSVSGSTARLGWDGQTSMEAARATDPNAMPAEGGAGVQRFNPGVYCSGYSTTNHEFFHTIHQYGLSSADSQTIQTAYDAKKTEVPAAPPAVEGAPAPAPLTANDTEWADGIRRRLDGTASENYASSTVYEYFAQTGCAFQGTNTGVDPYTQRPRNNGRAWVLANEATLGPLLSKICSSTELTNVNPRDARAAAGAAAPAAAPATEAAAGARGGAPPPPAPTTIGQVAPPEAQATPTTVGVLVER